MKPGYRDIAEAVAVVSVVASLIFVGYEMRLARAVAMAEAYGYASELGQGVRSLIAENTAVWHMGCSGEQLTGEERLLFTTIYLAVNNNRFTTWGRARTGVAGADPNVFAREMAELIYHYPSIQALWDEQGRNNAMHQEGLNNPPWRQAVAEQLQLLEDMGVARELGVNWCTL